MRRHIVQTAAALAVMACSAKAPPETAANPARGLLKLAPGDAEVTAIAVEAARSLPPRGNSKSFFAGVFVDGVKASHATDAVVRATGFGAVSSSTRPVVAQCRRQNMTTGQSTPIPCPASAVAEVPPVYSFVEVRATADSAYVGSTKAAIERSDPICITLVRAASGWQVLHALPITDAKLCGK